MTDDQSKQIQQAVNRIDEDALVALALELCSAPSPVGDNREVVPVVHGAMQRAGLRSRVLPFTSTQSNVLGVLEGAGHGRRLMFNVNTETDFSAAATIVPPARVVGDAIHGVGIWNMKASLAAAVSAVAAVRDAGIDLAGDVVVAGVAGMNDQASVETRIRGDHYRSCEGYGIGTKHLLAHGGVADVAVVGTPSSFKLIQQHFGATGVRIDIGEPWMLSGASEDLTTPSLPMHPGAIERASEIVMALREWAPGYQQRNAVAGIPPSVRLSAIEGGAPWSPVPATQASLFLFVGTPPGAPETAVLDEVRSVLARMPADAWYEAHAELYSINPGPSVRDDSPIVTSLRAAHEDVFGRPPDTAVVAWHSDASPMTRHGIAAVNYGPAGRLCPASEMWPEHDEAVRAGESVRVHDLVACARVYAGLTVRICT